MKNKCKIGLVIFFITILLTASATNLAKSTVIHSPKDYATYDSSGDESTDKLVLTKQEKEDIYRQIHNEDIGDEIREAAIETLDKSIISHGTSFLLDLKILNEGLIEICKLIELKEADELDKTSCDSSSLKLRAKTIHNPTTIPINKAEVICFVVLPIEDSDGFLWFNLPIFLSWKDKTNLLGFTDYHDISPFISYALVARKGFSNLNTDMLYEEAPWYGSTDGKQTEFLFLDEFSSTADRQEKTFSVNFLSGKIFLAHFFKDVKNIISEYNL